MTLNSYWPLIKNLLKKEVNSGNFEAWLSRVELVKTTSMGRKAIITVPSNFHKKYIKNKFEKKLLSCITRYYPKVIHLEYQIINSETPNAVQQDVFGSTTPDLVQKITTEAKPKVEMIPSKNIHNLNPKYTLDTFVVNSSNQLAVSVAKAIVKNPGKAYNPVFLYSGVGLGKTHLLQAIGQELVTTRPDLQLRYVTCESFFSMFIQSIQDKTNKSFKDYFRSVDVLLIDDIQFISGKEATQEAFFHTFNALHQANKQVVITSDKPPKALSTIEQRLLSRFEWGLVVDISKPDFEDRMSVAKAKVKQMGVTLSDEQLAQVVNVVNTNYRDLEGVLNRIQARMTLLPGVDFGDQELDKILTGYSGTSSTVNISINQNHPAIQDQYLSCDLILDTVAKIYSLKKTDLISKNRSKHLAKARQVAMYLLKTHMELSFPTIGKELNRDHSTVLHACRRIKNELETDDRLIEKVKQIEAILPLS